MKMNPVCWFEIPVNDMEKAKKFYESVFDFELTFSEMGPYIMAMFPMIQDASGTSGSLMKSEGYKPSKTGSLLYFCVDDIEATLTKVTAGGGITILPKTSIGEYGFIAHFEDCEGNKVALHSTK